jgi:hypothetical protein
MLSLAIWSSFSSIVDMVDASIVDFVEMERYWPQQIFLVDGEPPSNDETNFDVSTCG